MPIRVADDVFGRLDDGWYEDDPAVEVVTGAPREVVARALHRAADRWMGVTDSGHDLSRLTPDSDEFHAELERLRDEQGRESWDVPYTPNYVYGVGEGVHGVTVSVDCKGAFTRAMAETLLRVLREELGRAGIEDADVVARTVDEDGQAVQRWYYGPDGERLS